jgi:probable phosphoglycerate mutase
MSESQVRIIRGLQNLRLRHPQETVAVISHADMIKAAVAHYAGIHLDMFHRIESKPASPIHFIFSEQPGIHDDDH